MKEPSKKSPKITPVNDRELDTHSDQSSGARLAETEALLARSYSRLEAIFEAGQKFSQAGDENEMIKLVLRLVVDLTSVAGISFVPLDEHGQPMAATSYGEQPFPVMKAWLEYLASPGVRSRCQICSRPKGFTDSCPLLKGPVIDASSIYCLRLRRGEQEYGVFNLYVPDKTRLDEGSLSFLGALTEQTALAIEGLRLRKKEQNARSQIENIRQRAALHKIAAPLSPVVEDPNLIVEIEYQAMIEERFRLAREIHDGLAQTLGYLKLQAAQMKNYLSREDYGRIQIGFDQYYQTLSEAYQDARSAIDGLRLSPAGGQIRTWLEESIANFAEISSIQIELRTMDSASEIPSEVQAQLMRIVQEALNNVRKHAHAQHVWVDCFEQAELLNLRIEDDGDGFTPADTGWSYHHGLTGMQERAELIGANFQVTSRPGAGTTVLLLFPIQVGIAQELEP